MKNKPLPGVSRNARISDEGLQRLDTQLQRGTRVATPVLAQWIKRYGDEARQIIRQHGQWRDELDHIL